MDNGIDLDINQIFEYARKGVIRASAFSGAVLNEKNNFNIKQWRIFEQYELIPEPVNNEETINEFKSFVVHNSLCEMMSLFEKTLTELYKKIYYLNCYNERKIYDEKIANNLTKKFSGRDFPKKIKIISRLLRNVKSNKNLWENLKYVRNCVAHNNSLVNKGEIKLKIKAFTCKMVDQITKEEYYFTPDNPIHKIQNMAGHTIQCSIKLEEKEKIFYQGDKIKFSPQEIAFLFYTMLESINELYRAFLIYLIEQGMQIKLPGNDKLITTKEELIKFWKNEKQEVHLSLNAMDNDLN
jgi:hypothetical protein